MSEGVNTEAQNLSSDDKRILELINQLAEREPEGTPLDRMRELFGAGVGEDVASFISALASQAAKTSADDAIEKGNDIRVAAALAATQVLLMGVELGKELS